MSELITTVRNKVAHIVNLKTAIILYVMGIEIIVTDGKYLTIRKEEEIYEHQDTSSLC